MTSSAFRRTLTLALAAGTLVSLAACSSGNPLEAGGDAAADGAVTVGAAAFAENEIIAQIYAQALEAAGVEVSFAGQIGQRDVYLKALEDGSLDLVPEYSGNLLQAFDSDFAGGTAEEVAAALPGALPEGLSVLEAAPAENTDSYTVTAEFSAEHGLTSLDQLAGLGIPLSIGGNPELESRPYGPAGLTEVYGVPRSSLTFTSISDSGGPLTVAALKDGTVQLADIFTTTPAIAENGFVVLDDPKNLILAQSVIPLLSERARTPEVEAALNAVSAKLTTADLIELNARNQGDEKASPKKLAASWLAEAGLG